MISFFTKGGAECHRGFGGEALNKQKSPLGQLLGEAQAQPEPDHAGVGPRGCGGRMPSLFWGVGYPRPILPEPKMP